MENLKNIDEIAKILYDNAMDMDFMDYEDTKEQTINELKEALTELEKIAKNYKQNYWITLWNALQLQK